MTHELDPQLSLRFVNEVCCLLRLPRVCSKTAMQYFTAVEESQNEFGVEILMGAAIFLTSKIFEEERKIRDVLNMIFAVTSLHRQLRHAEIPITDLLEWTHEDISEMVQPRYSINNYNDYKGQILQAEQQLLRIIGFDFSAATINMDQYKSLLIVIHQLRLPQPIANIALDVYNELYFFKIEVWIAGILYFAHLVKKVAQEQACQHEQASFLSDKEWEMLFCTQILALREYAGRIAAAYSKKQSKSIHIKQEQMEAAHHAHNPQPHEEFRERSIVGNEQDSHEIIEKTLEKPQPSQSVPLLFRMEDAIEEDKKYNLEGQ